MPSAGIKRRHSPSRLSRLALAFNTTPPPAEASLGFTTFDHLVDALDRGRLLGRLFDWKLRRGVPAKQGEGLCPRNEGIASVGRVLVSRGPFGRREPYR